MTRVGWVGLGAMGAPMVSMVGRTHDVAVYDIVPEAVARVATHRIVAAPSVAVVAEHADVLAIMVATPAQADEVLFGPGGAARHLKQGAVVLLMGTVGPEPIHQWAARLAERGIGLVDAPVSGGVARAASGDLLVMVSGSSTDVALAESVLDAIADRRPLVGDVPGDGQKVKLVNQLLCGTHIAVAAEALALAGALGLDPRACWEVIRHGAAASFMLDDRGARMLDEAFDEPKSAIDIFVKDMGLVTDAATEVGAWTPMAAAARDLYLEGSEYGLGRKDDSALISVIRSHDTTP